MPRRGLEAVWCRLVMAATAVPRVSSEGGSEYTERMAQKHGKPCLHVDFDEHDTDQAVLLVKTWLADTQPRVLNVAGPRASQDPEVYSKAKCVLTGALVSDVHQVEGSK